MQLDLSIFNPKARSLIGLDISSSAVKMVELASDGKGGYRVERYAIEVLPRDAVADGNIINLDVTTETIKRAWRKLSTSTRAVAAALPASHVITKKIIVAAGYRDQELELIVESEANQYIPFPLDEVNLDFQVLGPAPTSPEEIEVLIAASRKEKVEDRVAAIDGAGLKPVVMDVESYAVLSSLELIQQQIPEGERGKIIALVDVGANLTNLTVLRDGHYIGTTDVADTDIDRLVEWMVGRRLEQAFPPKPELNTQAPNVLEATGVQLTEGAPSNSFFLREGEILGFAGLVGSGRSELARAVIGADPAFRKEVVLHGTPTPLKDTAEALEKGIGLLPESRKTEGLIVDFSIRDNISINNLKKYLGVGPFIDRHAEYTGAERVMKRVGVKAPGPSSVVGQLSGGNQQKVVIARWLDHHCKVLIFDEPTRGIDVGAKAEIYALMRQLTGDGYSIIFISSELPEIVGLCDRVAVFKQGAIVATLEGKAINSNEVMRYATTGN